MDELEEVRKKVIAEAMNAGQVLLIDLLYDFTLGKFSRDCIKQHDMTVESYLKVREVMRYIQMGQRWVTAHECAIGPNPPPLGSYL